MSLLELSAAAERIGRRSAEGLADSFPNNLRPVLSLLHRPEMASSARPLSPLDSLEEAREDPLVLEPELPTSSSTASQLAEKDPYIWVSLLLTCHLLHLIHENF
jgi:hypothetical protein